MCSHVCESNFISIYEKFDKFGEHVFQTLNKTNVELSHELKKIIDEMSLALIMKTKMNIAKINDHHARLEATSRVLQQLLTVEKDKEFVSETRHMNRGLNIYQFIVLCIVFMCIGINFEVIRSRRKGYTEIE